MSNLNPEAEATRQSQASKEAAEKPQQLQKFGMKMAKDSKDFGHGTR